ncbi:MAG: APC family permease [Actinomycetota bacterium]|nr:APC family permease [Actinomycetota bacterium]
MQQSPSRDAVLNRDRGGWTKRLLLGRALASHKAEHQLLPKLLALPVFASDQLSSVAYATEEMLLVLVLVGASGLSWLSALSVGVAALLVIVIASYRQTVREYPQGGGSYIVAKENLGLLPGLTAAGAIQISYVLTVAVSVTAGAIAVTSAVPSLAPYKLPMAIGFIALITLANLRGAKEAGRLFAIPTYGFVVVVGATLVWGTWLCASDGCPRAATADLRLEAVSGLSVLLVLRAFSSGATALTGVEAIADGVQAFRRPQSKNAASTLLLMGSMSIPMFLGISALASAIGVRTNEHIAASTSVLAQIGETVFGDGPMFLVLQVFTALILILAANTAYQDFPRLASILARDGFMPSQFRNRGDRLVFSNGIAVLAGLAALLVWLFDADLTKLIQLYVVGVFVALTLSQAGMVRRWWRLRTDGWRAKAAVNVIGATTTAVVFAIVVATRFSLGAWMVIAALPIVVGQFYLVSRHYRSVARTLDVAAPADASDTGSEFLFVVPDLGAATRDGIAYLRAIRPERVTALYIGPAAEFDLASAEWDLSAPRLGELERLPDADHHLVRALRALIRTRSRAVDGFLTVIVPENSGDRSLLRQIAHNRRLFWLKTSMLFEPGVVVTDVPLLPEEASTNAGRPLEPERSFVIVPVSNASYATARAVTYARSLHAVGVEALFLVTDNVEIEGVANAWVERGFEVPLVMVEAPFRDLGTPLLEEIRKHTARGDTIVTVVLPEVVPLRWWQTLLHGQTALYFKRMLLFEPHVVVTSVPLHLREPEIREPPPQGDAPLRR